MILIFEIQSLVDFQMVNARKVVNVGGPSDFTVWKWLTLKIHIIYAKSLKIDRIAFEFY